MIHSVEERHSPEILVSHRYLIHNFYKKIVIREVCVWHTSATPTNSFLLLLIIKPLVLESLRLFLMAPLFAWRMGSWFGVLNGGQETLNQTGPNGFVARRRNQGMIQKEAKYSASGCCAPDFTTYSHSTSCPSLFPTNGNKISSWTYYSLSAKSPLSLSVLCEHSIHLHVLTETWLSPETTASPTALLKATLPTPEAGSEDG